MRSSASTSPRARRPYGEGWAAAGDAAIALDPVLGNGVARALDGGRRAARTYLASLTAEREQGRALWQGNGRALQAEYEREREAIRKFHQPTEPAVRVAA